MKKGRKKEKKEKIPLRKTEIPSLGGIFFFPFFVSTVPKGTLSPTKFSSQPNPHKYRKGALARCY